jgi:hypothetical protein
MGEVEAAAAGHQQFAAEGAHAVMDGHRHSGAAQTFGRIEARRSAADHRHRFLPLAHATL